MASLCLCIGLSFPINDERKSGLLFPTIRFGDNWGFNLEVPYYWNINPRGTRHSRPDIWPNEESSADLGEFRYMGETGFGDYSGMLRMANLCRMTRNTETAVMASVIVIGKTCSAGALDCPSMLMLAMSRIMI